MFKLWMFESSVVSLSHTREYLEFMQYDCWVILICQEETTAFSLSLFHFQLQVWSVNDTSQRSCVYHSLNVQPNLKQAQYQCPWLARFHFCRGGPPSTFTRLPHRRNGGGGALRHVPPLEEFGGGGHQPPYTSKNKRPKLETTID